MYWRRKPKGGKKRRAEEQSIVKNRAKKGKPTDKDGKPLAGEALQRKQEYDSMAKKLGKAKMTWMTYFPLFLSLMMYRQILLMPL
eukprot:jgi/Tetstr1/458457/TSEL_004312.t1